MNCASNVRALAIIVAVSMALFPCLTTAAQENYGPWPQPDAGYVTDKADVLTSDEEERIEQWLIRVEHGSGVEIIVVTIGSIRDFPGTRNASIESFARGLFDRWGIGNFPRNDGVLLLVAIDDRNVRIELGKGYGGVRDADANKIVQQEILPAFRKGDYAKGITDGTKAIVDTFTPMRVGVRWELILVPVGIVASLLIGLSLIKNGKKGWGWVFVGLALVLLLFLIKILFKVLARRYGRSSGWSAGGLGGFGGGSSGGGGATGSW